MSPPPEASNPGISQANAGFYAGANLAYSDAKNADVDGSRFGINFGYDFPLFIPLAAELEYSYNDMGNVEISSYGANGYFFIPFPIVSPYLGYGVGTADTDSVGGSAEESYQNFIAGVRFDLPVLPLSISAEYRLQKIEGAGDDIMQALLGVKYMF